MRNMTWRTRLVIECPSLKKRGFEMPWMMWQAISAWPPTWVAAFVCRLQLNDLVFAPAALGPADIARYVIRVGCHSTQETRVQSAFGDVASDMH
jgi:hypothetical protein